MRKHLGRGKHPGQENLMKQKRTGKSLEKSDNTLTWTKSPKGTREMCQVDKLTKDIIIKEWMAAEGYAKCHEPPQGTLAGIGMCMELPKCLLKLSYHNNFVHCGFSVSSKMSEWTGTESLKVCLWIWAAERYALALYSHYQRGPDSRPSFASTHIITISTSARRFRLICWRIRSSWPLLVVSVRNYWLHAMPFDVHGQAFFTNIRRHPRFKNGFEIAFNVGRIGIRRGSRPLKPDQLRNGDPFGIFGLMQNANFGSLLMRNP